MASAPDHQSLLVVSPARVPHARAEADVAADAERLGAQVDAGVEAAFGLWVAGLSPSLQPLQGGVLVPTPDLVLGHFADAVGRAGWTLPMTSTLPTGLGLWLQAWYLDPTQPSGVRATNGLSTRTP